MEVFNFLCRIKDNFTTDEFTHLLHQLTIKRFSVPITRVSQQLKASFRNPSRHFLRPEFDSMMDKALADPSYEIMVTRVADNFTVLYQAHQHLPRSEFTHFVACFEFDQPPLTNAKWLANLDKLKQRMAPMLRERLDTILAHPLDSIDDDDWGSDGMIGQVQHQDTWPAINRINPPQQHTFIPPQGSDQDMNVLIRQAHTVLRNDPALCQQFSDVLEFDQINGILFSDTMNNIHQWIQHVNPALWPSLVVILEQMQTLQESTTNQNDYGQQQLVNEIEQVHVQRLFSNLSM
ncbi:hypothetical protein BC941DRAFT_438306 [Chlamydoabsidia padenii]|nr:hypothetical protein BC941DRAFT_438306 [Chlamydoabsidia padenii]